VDLPQLLTDGARTHDDQVGKIAFVEPLALAIVVETGGAGANHLVDYQQLDAILDALAGGVEHRVAVIGFDSKAASAEAL
jgi:hypothetical protein